MVVNEFSQSSLNHIIASKMLRGFRKRTEKWSNITFNPHDASLLVFVSNLKFFNDLCNVFRRDIGHLDRGTNNTEHYDHSNHMVHSQSFNKYRINTDFPTSNHIFLRSHDKQAEQAKHY